MPHCLHLFEIHHINGEAGTRWDLVPANCSSLHLVAGGILFSRLAMEQLETKCSRLKEELVNTKEALNKAVLARDVIAHEKQEIGTRSRTHL